MLVEQAESDEGLIVLSKEKADKLRVWDLLSAAYDNSDVVEGVITGRVKGGLSVNLAGVKAFLPGSQVDLRPVRNLDRMIGESHKFKIIKFNKRRGNIVLSRRALLETERQSLRQKTLEILQGGSGRRGHRQEHHRLRRVHRPGRHRRSAPHHRHVVGAHRASVGAVPGRRLGARARAQVRRRDGARQRSA